MKVTVLITLYNKGPFVEEALRSILANTFTDFEVLIVDDASTDGGLALVKNIPDPRIRILESAVNTGRAAAANRGYDTALGEYVAVLDADDIMDPTRLAKQVEFMDAHPEVGACGTGYRVMGQPERTALWPATDRECRGSMLFGDPLIYGTAIFRRAVLETFRLRCNADWRRPGMDYLFTLSLGPHARYANLQEPLLVYRMGENNMRHGRDILKDRLVLLREIFRFFGFPVTEEQLDLHLAFHDLLNKPFDAGRVRSLWTWKNELARLNRERELFPSDLFEAELDRRWDRLFHPFADRNIGAALAHQRLSRKWPVAHLSYLAKTTLNRWTGRNR